MNNRITKSKTDARAGVTGHNVRWVLLVSTVAVVCGFVIVYVVLFGK